MLSLGGEDNNLKKTKSTFSSSSFSSSSSTSPSSTLTLSGPAHFEIIDPANNKNKKKNPNPTTMEEAWKEINLSSLHNHSTGYRGVILQDFLAKPFSKAPPPNTLLPAAYGSPTPPPPPPPQPPPPPPPPPPALLNLNSNPDHQLDLRRGLVNPTTVVPNSNVGPLTIPFDDVLPTCTSSTLQQADHNDPKSFTETRRSSGGGDRRHKRMIKNRESAARSRARKQAYTNELQIEIERLKEENTLLRKQQQLSEAAASAAETFPKKTTLQRTSTAPF